MRTWFAVVAVSMLVTACDGGALAPSGTPGDSNSPDEQVDAALQAEMFALEGHDPSAVTDDISDEPVFGAAQGPSSEIGSWGPVLPWPFVPVSMAHLPDGRILSYSGSERRTWPSTEQTYSAIWDPETGAFSENFFRGHNMFCGALTSTADGRVLVNGGRNQGNSPWTSLFDYRDEDWHVGENMASGGRWYPTTLSLGDGTVLTGMGSATNVRNPDLWDPDEGWKVLNGADLVSLRTRRGGGGNHWFPQLSLAPDGNVFHFWDTVETHLINTSGSGTTATVNSATDDANHGTGVHLMFDEGKLMVSGANDGGWSGNTNKAFIIDLNSATPDIRATNPMRHARTFHQLIPMPNGEVMVVGGTAGRKFTDAGGILEPEIWNPQTGQWRGMANMSVVRGYHSTALLLPDATVLAAGGGYGGGDHLDGQVFTPPYLYASDGSLAPRPTLSADVSAVDVGNTFQVTTTGDIRDFGFVRMSATTHAVNTDSRFYKPEFEQTGTNTWSVKIHQNPNVATPGFWMLFALDADGVPSVAEIIQVTAVDTRLSNLALGATATQSSTYATANAGLAIDGNKNGNNANASLAITNNDAQAWWELDLGRTVEIDSIRLWNRTDCCGDRLSDFHVLVSEAPFSSRSLAEVQAQDGVSDYAVAGAAGQQTDIAVGRFGRYVRVQLEGTNYLQLAEVQVFGQLRPDISNLALQGTASQSSQWRNDSRYPASNVINDDTSGNGAVANRMNHTNADRNAWWELDLGDVYDLDSIKIWNRNDCCQDRLSDFVLLVSDTPFNSKDLNASRAQAGVYSKVFPGAPERATESILGRTGRYIRVQLSGTNFLHLAEVQVFGAPLAVPLELTAIEPVPQPQQGPITFSADATGTGTLQYQWNFGDGTPDTEFSTNATASHQYAAPGRYVVSVTVKASNGDEERQTFTQIVHGNLTADQPVRSGGMVEVPARQQLWNVNPDNNSVTVINTDSYSVLSEIEVGEDPSSAALAPDGRIWVVNRHSATISVVNTQTLSVDGAFALPRASQPYGIVFDDTHAYVSLEATGEIVKLTTDGSVAATGTVGSNPRHLSLDANAQTLYVSRFITPLLPGEETINPVIEDDTGPYGGELLVVNPTDLTVTDTIVLAHSNREPSEHQGPGIPNYLGAAVISPAGGNAWLPSKQDNILAGGARGGVGITFDQTVRAITSFIDLEGNTENLARRVDHDNSSVAGFAAFDPYGTTLFISLEGNRQISLIDSGEAIEIGRIDTGRAPQSLLVSADGMRLYVHNFMDRSISVFDISAIVNQGAVTATELATVNAVANELLQPQVLRGKQLFYDARDDRLAMLDYMSCASCHVDGEHDGRVWDFTSLGEGLRNTITLKGRSGMGHGMLHWTGNFDELQDFEGQIREFAGGTGLMFDTDFANTSGPLGNQKTGLSEDLDALAAYMTSLVEVADSPYRAADGSLTAEAEAGQTLFAANGCAGCHADVVFTDSATASLHDIGTLMPDSGNRLGETLTGLDTPTLLGIWRTAPYLHDGSAATLQDAVAAHLDETFSQTELDQLAAYLQQLDQSSENPPPPPPIDPPVVPSVPSNLVTTPIALDGSLSDWAGLISFGTDPDDAGSGNPIDWRETWMAHDSDNFYIAYQADAAVTDSWGYGIYIDTDGNRNTGFRGFGDEYPIGADYLIESTDVQRYTGNGTNWSWQSVGTAQRGAAAAVAELSVPRALLGNPNSLNLFFRGDNSAVLGTVVDVFPDSALDASADSASRHLVYTVIASNGNTPPTANSQSVAVATNGTINITLSGDDVNGDVLTFEVADLPANGSISGTAPNLTYTPAPDFSGIDSFTFNTNDGTALSNLATITVVVQGGPATNPADITIDGNLDDWANTTSFGVDPADANNLNDSIDWREGWIAHDAANIYFAYRGYDPLTPSWGNGIYIDTDNNPLTGYRGWDGRYAIGADYLIEDRYLQRYTGSGTNWSWAGEADVPVALNGTDGELSVSRAQLGNPSLLKLFFIGENSAVGGSTVDYYPDGAPSATSPVRFFSYGVDGDALNVPPVAAGQSVQTQKGNAVNITVSATDVDNDAISYRIVNAPANGALSGTAPNLVYTPVGTFTGIDSFVFVANDGTQDSEPAVVSITVIGDVPPSDSVSNAVDNIVLDGNLTDWAAVDPYLADPVDISGENNYIDWRQIWMAHTDSTYYVAWQNANTVAQMTWGYSVYLDTDTNATTGFKGFSGEYAIGADYVLEGADLYRYTGTGQNWSWEFLETLQYVISGNIAEIAMPRAIVGNTNTIEFVLHGDSAATNGTSVDHYPDAAPDATAPVSSRRFRYSTSE